MCQAGYLRQGTKLLKRVKMSCVITKMRAKSQKQRKILLGKKTQKMLKSGGSNDVVLLVFEGARRNIEITLKY